MKVVKSDDSNYIVDFDNHLYRVWHSDVAGTPFVSVQDLDKPEQKFTYLKYALSPDGKTLTAYAVNSDTLPKTVRTSAAVRKLLRQNLANPKLYVDNPLELVKQR